MFHNRTSVSLFNVSSGDIQHFIDYKTLKLMCFLWNYCILFILVYDVIIIKILHMQQFFELYRAILTWQTEGGLSYRGEQELTHQVCWLSSRCHPRLLAGATLEPSLMFSTEVSCLLFWGVFLCFLVLFCFNTRYGKCIRTFFVSVLTQQVWDVVFDSYSWLSAWYQQ